MIKPGEELRLAIDKMIARRFPDQGGGCTRCYQKSGGEWMYFLRMKKIRGQVGRTYADPQAREILEALTHLWHDKKRAGDND